MRSTTPERSSTLNKGANSTNAPRGPRYARDGTLVSSLLAARPPMRRNTLTVLAPSVAEVVPRPTGLKKREVAGHTYVSSRRPPHLHTRPITMTAPQSQTHFVALRHTTHITTSEHSIQCRTLPPTRQGDEGACYVSRRARAPSIASIETAGRTHQHHLATTQRGAHEVLHINNGEHEVLSSKPSR